MTQQCRPAMAILAITLSFILIPVPALAYTDPGTASILVQLLLGGIGGGLVILKLYWYRFKAFFQRDQQPAAGDTKDDGEN
jgi:hypothetical protein